MQVIKENTKNAILETAKEEFLACGFKAASMRSIARKADVNLSNIYTYFRGKDDIFRAMVDPFICSLNAFLKKHHSGEYVSLDVFVSGDYQHHVIASMMRLVRQYRDIIFLLLFRAGGSSFENFREEIVEENICIGVEYMQLMKEKYPHLNIEVSELFVRITGRWWVSVLEEIARHNDLSDDEAEQFIADYVKFGTAGWKKLLDA